MSEETVALWYWRRYSLRYSLHDDEGEAALAAVYMEANDDGGVVAGVQFADGRLIASPEGSWVSTREWWPAYKAAEIRHEEQWREREARAKPTPTRQITDPFGHGQKLTVEADAPGWLGAP